MRSLGHKKITVGVFPCNSENAKSIGKCLSNQVNFKTIGLASKDQLYKSSMNYFHHAIDPLPTLEPLSETSNNNDFIDTLNNVCAKYGINCIIPTHDTVALTLAQIRSKLNVPILTSAEITAFACRHKSRTYELLREHDFCPKIFSDYQVAKAHVLSGGKVYSKPSVGQGGRNAYVIEKISDFSVYDMVGSHTNQVPVTGQRILMEVIGNEHSSEVTVDCFSTKDGKLLIVAPRERFNIDNGIANACKYLVHEAPLKYFTEIAERIASTLQPTGMWYFQMRSDDKCPEGEFQYKLLEVSCRPSTGIDYALQIGINFPALAVYDHFGFPVETPVVADVLQDISLHRGTHIRSDLPQVAPCGTENFYYEHIFIDLFDTLILFSTPPGFQYVNPKVMALIYDKCQTKKIHLITRLPEGQNRESAYNYLDRMRIETRLFENILVCFGSDNKSDLILNAFSRKVLPKDLRAIFVDNSFYERQEVAKALAIPVFDVNAIDCLLSKNC